MDQLLMTRPVVTVLGMHRSGTSLCANLLHALGVDMADEAGVSPNNQKGHWERPRINDLNEQVFERFGRSWSHAAHILALPEGWLADARVQAIRVELTGVVARGLGSTRLWGFKDPRTARLLPLWREVFAAAGAMPRFIFCIRNPGQVARSIHARDKMARDQAEYRWLLYNAEAVRGLGVAAVCVVPYEAWFSQPDHTMRRVAAFVGLPEPSARLAAGIVDPTLRHDDDSAPPARPLAGRLHRLILRAAQDGGGRQGFDPDLQSFCACVGEFEQQVQPLLVDREVLRASVADQNRVIGDLNAVIRDLRRAAA
jgi:hypothetical protein